MARRKAEKGHFQSQRILPPGPRATVTIGTFERQPEHLIVSPSSKTSAPSIYGYRCTGAWEVKNASSRRSRFEQTASTIGNVQTLFHGTPGRNITTIAAEGLRPGGKYCMFGSAIYLGSPSKAMGYTGGGGGSFRFGEVSCAHYIIEVRAALGKPWEMASADTRLTLEKVWGTGFHPEPESHWCGH